MGYRNNPLNHRFLRELKGDFGKYFVIFLLMLMSISFVSGFLVADNSMLIAYEEGFEKYNIEHGHFETRNPLNPSARKAIRRLDITIYDNRYAETSLNNGSTLRIYAMRDSVNLLCLMKGEFPSAPDEIIIDRMYADNNHIRIGDALTDGTHIWKVSGLAAFGDYSCLFQNNSDSMFDAVKFSVACLTPQGFEALKDLPVTYCYAWRYPKDPSDREEEHDWSEKLLKQLREIVPLQDYVPRYQNQAITFTGEDMGSDKVMMEVLLYIIIAIIAFVFTITINDTIRRESAVIGTLLASGYTRKELTEHYMAVPVTVTVVSALIGNILGYTVMKNVAADMYYASYSLPVYVTVWNADAFIRTTIIPILIMIAITSLTLQRQLRRSPLLFLRGDLSSQRRSRAFFLPHALPIMTKYRMRILLQNAGSYLVLFVGILFSNLLLMFGMQLPALMTNFQAVIDKDMIASYQYILNIPLSLTDSSAMKTDQLLEYMEYASSVSTENPTAEKFSVYTLKTEEVPGSRQDQVMIYGIRENSRYVDLHGVKDEVCVSSAYAEKYDLHPGDAIRLKEEFLDRNYTFTVGSVVEYMSGIAVFMPMEKLNETFDLGRDTFAGYFSRTEITDIPRRYISTVIDRDELSKITRQLMVSMGDLMYLVDVFAVVMYIILIYLLSRMIIEKNAKSISLTRILGFTGSETAGLYILSTTIAVLVSMAVSIPLLKVILIPLFRTMLRKMMSGWLPLTLDPMVNARMFVIGLAAYAAVAVFEYRKIRKIPLEEALKNAE